MRLSRHRPLGPLLAPTLLLASLLSQQFVVVVHAFSTSSPQLPPPAPAAVVVCVGETLYDSLPDAIFLGGAVTNVAVHLASLGVPAAGKVKSSQNRCVR